MKSVPRPVVSVAISGPAPRPPHVYSLAWPGAVVLLIALMLPAEVWSQEVGVVRGQVRSESSGQPLTSAALQLIRPEWSGSTTTDRNGGYRIADVPVGRSILRVRHIGHEPLELEVVVAAGREVVLDVSLPIRPVALAPVRVDANTPRAEADSVPTTNAELAIVGAHALEGTPGLSELGLGEAIRGIPGNEPPDPGSVLYVRGAAADLKLVYLDGAPVYAPFPLGGLMEPFAPELLHQAEIYLGGAPARYDGGLSYVMDLRTRGAIVEGARTSGSVDLLSARVLAEAGVADRLRVIGTVRGMHPLASSGIFGDPLAYEYQEGVIRADARLTESLSLSATGFTNSESVRVGLNTPSDNLIQWGNSAGSLRLRGTIGETGTEITAAVGDYSATLPFAGSAPLVANGEARRTRLSADFARRLEGVQVRYGASMERQNHRAVAHTVSTLATAGAIEAEGEVFGVYGEAGGQIGSRVSVRGGMRVDRFSAANGVTLGPRLAGTWLITDRAALTVAAGGYHQFVRPPDEVLLDAPELPTELRVARSLTVGRASHFTIGLDQDLGDGLGLGIEGFYKDFSDIPGSASRDANASGVDFWVRRSAGGWDGWLGYSLAWVWSNSATAQQANFTGRHLLSAGFGAPLGERTRLDLRFAYGAGLPYSAIPLGTVTESFSGHDTNYVTRSSLASADRGGTETAPLLHPPDEPYLRLDASLSQLWTPQAGDHVFEISPYIRVLNSLGRRDALFYYFNRDDGQGTRAIGSLPIVPIIGVEWKL